MGVRSKTGLGALALLFALSTSIAACTGWTGDPGATDGFHCIETPTVLAGVTAASPIGLTGADVLAHASASVSEPLHWIDPAASPEHGDGEITLGVTYEGGEVRFIDAEPPPEATIAVFCPDRVEVDVSVAVTTAGGALAETFAAPLAAIDPTYASLSHGIDATSLAGTLTVSPPDGLRLTGVSIDASFYDGGTSGTVGASFEGEMVASHSVIARWPTVTACDPDRIATSLDQALLGFTASDALALAGTAVPGPASWSDGSSTTVMLGLSAATDTACVRATETTGDRSVLFAATLRAVSGDGRIDSTFPVVVEAKPSADATLGSVAVRFDRFTDIDGVAPSELPSAYGMSGFDVAGYDAATVEASVTYTPSATGATTTGHIAVLGLTIPECVRHPSATDGCQGIGETEVDSLGW